MGSVFTWVSLGVSIAIGLVAVFALANYSKWGCQGEANSYIVFSGIFLILSSLVGIVAAAGELSRPAGSTGSVVCDDQGCRVSGFVPARRLE